MLNRRISNKRISKDSGDRCHLLVPRAKLKLDVASVSRPKSLLCRALGSTLGGPEATATSETVALGHFRPPRTEVAKNDRGRRTVKRAYVQVHVCHPLCPRNTLIEHDLEMGRTTGLTETVDQTKLGVGVDCLLLILLKAKLF